MKKILILLFVSLATLSIAATTMLDDCEDTTYDTAAGTGESIVLVSDITDKTEGASSLEITYNFTAQDPWYKNAAVAKNFPIPVDISEMETFSFDLNLPTGDSRFMMTINFVDEQSHEARFDLYILDTATSGWETKTYRLSSLIKNMWANAGRAINMKKVSKIVYHIMNKEATDAGSISFNIDNVLFESGNDLLTEVILEDFESYSTDGDLYGDSGAWKSRFSEPESVTLDTVSPYAGSQAMQMQVDINDKWYTFAAEYTFSEPKDFSYARYFKVAISGDLDLVGFSPYLKICLVDGEGDRAVGYMEKWAEKEDWAVMYLPFLSGNVQGFADAGWTWEWGAGAASCWREDRYDNRPWNEDCDLDNIVSIILGIENQAGAAINDAVIKFDNVTVGYITQNPSSEPSDVTYNVNAVADYDHRPEIDGVASAGEWDAAASPGCTDFVLHSDKAVDALEDPTVKALWGVQYLYILFQINDSDFSLAFTPSGDGRDPSGVAFNGDDIEFFIAPAGPMADYYYHTVLFPYQGDNVCYVWDSFTGGATDGWNGTGDKAAFSYESSTNLLTVEYRIPWDAFDVGAALVESSPTDGDQWGIQIGYINNNPEEAVNWEPDDNSGFAAGRPYGTWIFSGVPGSPLAARGWELYE